MPRPSYREISELAGIIAIFVSLIFVGLELRQNSAVARVEASNSFKLAFAETVRETALNPELSKLIGDISFNEITLDDLTRQEFVQIRNYYMSVLFSWSALFQSVEEGVLDQNELEYLGGGGLFNSAVFREMWPGLKNLFTPEFIEFFESQPWNIESVK